MEVCHLVTRKNSKKFYLVLSEQHSEHAGLIDFSKDNCSRRISFLDQSIPPTEILSMSCRCLYTSWWKTNLILHLKSLTTIVEPSENDQRKQEHEGCHFPAPPLACGRRQSRAEAWAPRCRSPAGLLAQPENLPRLQGAHGTPPANLREGPFSSFRPAVMSKRVHPRACLTFWLSAKESDP